jgi:hypothetical protein
MMIINQRLEFTPPDGDPDRPILILGLQEYSPGQARKVDLWKLEPPAEFAALFGAHVEFDTYASMCATLANRFCDGDQAAVRDRIKTKR